MTQRLLWPLTRLGETLDAAASMAFAGPLATAVLIGQRILGAKTFGR